MKCALFICSQSWLRSPTAEQLCASWPDVETDSAGLGGDAGSGADEVPIGFPERPADA